MAQLQDAVFLNSMPAYLNGYQQQYGVNLGLSALSGLQLPVWLHQGQLVDGVPLMPVTPLVTPLAATPQAAAVQRAAVDLRWGRQLPSRHTGSQVAAGTARPPPPAAPAPAAAAALAAAPAAAAAAAGPARDADVTTLSREEQRSFLQQVNQELASQLPSSLDLVRMTFRLFEVGGFRVVPLASKFCDVLKRFIPTGSASSTSTSGSCVQQQQQPPEQPEQPLPALLHGSGPVVEKLLQRVRTVVVEALSRTKAAEALMCFNKGMDIAGVSLVNDLLPEFVGCLCTAGVSDAQLTPLLTQGQAPLARVLLANILHVLRTVFDSSIAPSMFLSPQAEAGAAQVKPVSEAEMCKVYYIGGYVASTLICKHYAHAYAMATATRAVSESLNMDYVHCLEVLKVAQEDRAHLPTNVHAYMSLVDRGNLTWVTPAFFDFLVAVERVVRKHLNLTNLGAGMVSALKDELLPRVAASLSLREQFAAIVEQGLSARVDGVALGGEHLAAATNLAYVQVVGLYIKVRVREFQRYIERQKSEHRRKDCLRRQLKNAAVTKKQALKFVINTGALEALGGVPGMHTALVGLVWSHGLTVIEHMTVPQLKLLCKAYGYNPNSQDLKPDLLNAAHDAILAVDASTTVVANKQHIEELCRLVDAKMGGSQARSYAAVVSAV